MNALFYFCWQIEKEKQIPIHHEELSTALIYCMLCGSHLCYCCCCRCRRCRRRRCFMLSFSSSLACYIQNGVQKYSIYYGCVSYTDTLSIFLLRFSPKNAPHTFVSCLFLSHSFRLIPIPFENESGKMEKFFFTKKMTDYKYKPNGGVPKVLFAPGTLLISTLTGGPAFELSRSSAACNRDTRIAFTPFWSSPRAANSARSSTTLSFPKSIALYSGTHSTLQYDSAVFVFARFLRSIRICFSHNLSSDSPYFFFLFFFVVVSSMESFIVFYIFRFNLKCDDARQAAILIVCVIVYPLPGSLQT